MRAGARLTERLPGAPITRDELAMIETGDNVAADTAAVETFGLAARAARRADPARRGLNRPEKGRGRFRQQVAPEGLRPKRLRGPYGPLVTDASVYFVGAASDSPTLARRFPVGSRGRAPTS